METHRLCQVLPCCWRAQHKIAGLLASLFCCLSFGKAIARCTADHLFASRKKKKENRPRSILGCFFSLSFFFFFKCNFSCFIVILDFYLITDSSVDVCMGTEAEQKAFLTVVGKRLFAGSTRYTCVLPVTLLEWNKFSQWFLALGRGVVWVSVVRSVDQTLCDVYQAWLHIFWGRKRRHFFGTCFPSAGFYRRCGLKGGWFSMRLPFLKTVCSNDVS